MTLQDIFDHLANSEFYDLSISGDPDQPRCLKEEDKPRVARATELGLINLYSRFRLKEGKLRLDLIPDMSFYLINPEYLVKQPNVVSANNYLTELDLPFVANPLKIESIHAKLKEGTRFYKNNKELEQELVLNKPNNELSIRTSTTNSVMIPAELIDVLNQEHLTITYRASHPKLNFDDTEYFSEGTPIELPFAYLDALLLYIAHKIFQPTGFSDNYHEGDNYGNKYERACQLLQAQNFDIDNVGEEDKFDDLGWR